MIGTFYVVPYYITPGMYVYNGLITSLFSGNNSTVVGDPDSEFSQYLNGIGQCNANGCVGTANEYIQNFFGGQFGIAYSLRNAIVLGCILIIARLFTWIALKYIRFSN